MADPDDVLARLGAAFARRGHTSTRVKITPQWVEVFCGCGAIWTIAYGVDVDTEEAFRWFEDPESCGALPETMPRCPANVASPCD